MASVLISDPEPETRTLLELLLQRLGHQPLDPRELAAGKQPELLIVEPASPNSLRQARALRRRLGQLPIVCVSIEPAGADARALRPAAYLIKPFRRAQLEQALTQALLLSPPPAAEKPPARACDASLAASAAPLAAPAAHRGRARLPRSDRSC